jgi:acyl-CoA hydrolase/GNAT superfamily N-acetyltransferase
MVQVNFKGFLMPKILNSDDAVKKIPTGRRIYIGSGAAVPGALLEGLERNQDYFQKTEIAHLMLLDTPGFALEKDSVFRSNSFFIGDSMRDVVQNGFADYTPAFLSEVPELFRRGVVPIGAALVSITPPNRDGVCSLGTNVDLTLAAIESAHVVIAQVNEELPFTYGKALVPFKRFDYVIEENRALPQLKINSPGTVAKKVAENVSSLIPAHATLQIGFGSIPQAVLRALKSREGLGIHSEVITDGVMDLMKLGAVTNESKVVLQGRTCTSMALGSTELYRYLHHNPLVEFYPSDFVNDLLRISQNPEMIAVNSALQVDLSGQVCADSLGERLFSGIGGHADFIRGAAMSRGGKPIIAMPSTACDGTVSRIAPELSVGSGVTTTRGDVHYVVTEFGVARLWGKSLRQRALELIRIAHPDFRPDLLNHIKGKKYIHFQKELIDPQANYPHRYEEKRNFKNDSFCVRPCRSTDESRVQEFLCSLNKAELSEEGLKFEELLSPEQVRQFLEVDYETSITMLVMRPDEVRGEVVAMANLVPGKERGVSELLLFVNESVRKQGVGAYLSHRLIDFARSKDVGCVSVACHYENLAMKKIMDGMRKEFVSSMCRQESGRYICYYYLVKPD